MAKITIDTILNRRKELREIWEPSFKKWKEMESYYDQTHTISYKSPAEPLKMPWARAKVQNMVDTLVTFSPKVHREPVKEGQAHTEKANKVEKWGQGVLRQVAVKNSALPPFRGAAIYITLLGDCKGVARLDYEVWDEDPSKRVLKKFPFVIEFPHPARILVPPFERIPTMVIESSSIYQWQLKRQYPKLRTQDKNDFDLMEMLTYWDDEWVGVVVDGEKVEIRKNGFPLIPYVHAFSGKGFERSPNYDAASSKESPNLGPRAQDLAEGLLAGLESTIKAADTHVTAMTYLARRMAYQTRYIAGDAEAIGKAEEEAGAGGLVSIGDSAKDITDIIRWEDVPNVSPFINQPLEMYKQIMDVTTFPDALGGIVPPNITTASGQAIQLGSIGKRFGMSMEQLNYIAGLLLGYCARMITERGESVTIDGITCSGDDFEGNYDFEVNFWAKDEGERMRLINTGLQMLKEGAIDERTFLEKYAGEEDSTKIERQKLVQKALNAPQVLESVINAAAVEFSKQHGVAPAQVPEAASPAMPTPAAPPASLTPLPGGVQQGAQVTQGMAAVPGGNMARVIPQ